MVAAKTFETLVAQRRQNPEDLDVEYYRRENLKTRFAICESVFKNFRTGRLERVLQVVQLSATRYSYIAIL
jgi:hypothetical protein